MLKERTLAVGGKSQSLEKFQIEKASMMSPLFIVLIILASWDVALACQSCCRAAFPGASDFRVACRFCIRKASFLKKLAIIFASTHNISWCLFSRELPTKVKQVLSLQSNMFSSLFPIENLFI